MVSEVVICLGDATLHDSLVTCCTARCPLPFIGWTVVDQSHGTSYSLPDLLTTYFRYLTLTTDPHSYLWSCDCIFSEAKPLCLFLIYALYFT